MGGAVLRSVPFTARISGTGHRRVYIPKPGKAGTGKAPVGRPLASTTGRPSEAKTRWCTAIDEADFLTCSCCGTAASNGEPTCIGNPKRVSPAEVSGCGGGLKNQRDVSASKVLRFVEHASAIRA